MKIEEVKLPSQNSVVQSLGSALNSVSHDISSDIIDETKIFRKKEDLTLNRDISDMG